MLPPSVCFPGRVQTWSRETYTRFRDNHETLVPTFTHNNARPGGPFRSKPCGYRARICVSSKCAGARLHHLCIDGRVWRCSFNVALVFKVRLEGVVSKLTQRGENSSTLLYAMPSCSLERCPRPSTTRLSAPTTPHRACHRRCAGLQHCHRKRCSGGSILLPSCRTEIRLNIWLSMMISCTV